MALRNIEIGSGTALTLILMTAIAGSVTTGVQLPLERILSTGTCSLKGAREYCRRLEHAALDSVCLEEVSEKLDVEP